MAMLKSLDDDSHVKTRLCQYEALGNGKDVEIARQIVLAKMRGQNSLLDKYDLKSHDEEAKNPSLARNYKREIARIKTILRERELEAQKSKVGTTSDE